MARKSSVNGLLTPMRQACPREGPSGATCVQRLDGSRDSAIHTTYRISLRSSSMREPRYPLPRVIYFFSLALATDANLERLADASAFSCSLASYRAVFWPTTNAPGGREGQGQWGQGGRAYQANILSRVHRSCSSKATTMILPQVHLRKPCYDFSFL